MTKKKQNHNNSGITMKDVAKLANLSEMTVSRVLTGKGYASKSAEEKVLAAANELGYFPNKLAGALASDCSNIVGVVLPNLSNAVFTEVVSGIYAGLKSKGLQPVFGVSEYSKSQEEQLVQDILSWRPLGIIITGLEHTRRTRNILKNLNQKVVEIIDIDGKPISHCIGLSHKKAGEMTAKHLLAKGYRRIAYIGSNLHLDIRAYKRQQAFEEIITSAGGSLVAQLTPKIASSMKLGRELTEELLANNQNIDAIYYSNDDMAAGGLMHCLASGIKPPDDIALASFNGLDFLDALPLKITTVKSPRFQVGQLAGEFMSDTDNTLPTQPITELEFIFEEGETT